MTNAKTVTLPFRKALLLALLGMAQIATALADEASYPAQRFRTAFGLTADSWSDLADLRPGTGGDFDETGAGLELSIHAQVAEWGWGALLLGGDLGGSVHDSDVRGVMEGEDLSASFGYLTPSAKIRLNRAGRQQYYLDAGAGYYSVTMDEWEDDCFWDCDIHEYYDDDTIGGYVGVSADLDVGADGGAKVAVAAKVHWLDLDDPVDLDAVNGLSGPIYQFQLSVVWGN